MEAVPRLAAPSRKFAEVVPERSRTFLPASWWDSQICQCGCHLDPDFGLFWGLPPHECSGAVPSPPQPPCPPQPWHNTEDNARVPPHQTARERERRRAAEGQMRSGRLQTWSCIKAKLNWFKKELSLKLIIYPREENHSPPPQPSAAWCQLSTLHQRLHLLAAIEAGPDGPDPRLQFIWGTDNTPKSFINPNIMYSIGTIGFQRANSLENRPDLFSLWSLTACFIFAGITRVDLGGWRWFLGGCLSTYFPH